MGPTAGWGGFSGRGRASFPQFPQAGLQLMQGWAFTGHVTTWGTRGIAALPSLGQGSHEPSYLLP